MNDDDEKAQSPPARPGTSVAKSAHRFSKEFLVTVISLLTTAFGVVVALAWNEALTAFFRETFSAGGAISALFIYAFVVTVIGVAVIVSLGKAASRIDAEPIEFKIATPKSNKDEGPPPR